MTPKILEGKLVDQNIVRIRALRFMTYFAKLKKNVTQVKELDFFISILFLYYFFFLKRKELQFQIFGQGYKLYYATLIIKKEKRKKKRI